MSELDTLFEALTVDTRRRVLLLLCESDVVRVPGDFLTRGAVRSADGGGRFQPHQSDPDSVSELEVMLYHNHLPKLEKEGYIDWDRDTGRISKGPEFEEIEPALRLFRANADVLPGRFI